MCKFNWGSWISDKVQLHKVTPRARERMHHLSVPIKQREKHEISIPALLPNIAVWGFWIILQFAATQRTLHKFSVQTKWLHRSIHRKSSRFSQVKNLKPKKNLCCTRLKSCAFLPSDMHKSEKDRIRSKHKVLGVVGSECRVRAQNYVTWVGQRAAESTNLPRVTLQCMLLSSCSTNRGFALPDLTEEITSTPPQEFLQS